MGQYCEQSFATHQRLSMHLYRKHRIRPLARLYARGTCCHACMFEFHSRARLLRHLNERAPVCLQYHKQKFPPLSEEEASVLDKEAASIKQSIKGLVTFRVPGPLPLHIKAVSGSLKAGRNHKHSADLFKVISSQ